MINCLYQTHALQFFGHFVGWVLDESPTVEGLVVLLQWARLARQIRLEPVYLCYEC